MCRAPLCNGRPHTAPQLFGRPFLLCWRCTSAALAIICATFVTWAFGLVPTGSPVVALALIGVGAVDGYRSYFTPAGTSNLNRFLFGLPLGLGVILLIWQLTGQTA